MKIIKRNVAGHFCDAENLGFFMHSDICADESTDAYSDALYCISLIGEYRPYPEHLNISGKKYELAVFDKKSENPWIEIDVCHIDNKEEAISAFREMVKKYEKLAEEK